MQILELMQECDLEIDDIRWYLASQQAERLLQYKENKADLVRLIWSGALEQDLYDMEERFLEQLQRDLDRGFRDEGSVREQLKKAALAREHRYAEQASAGRRPAGPPG